MNKSKFLSTLKESLRGIDQNSQKEIMYDYEEHFSIGIENGKTEEEISAALGDPRTIASQYKLDNAVKATKSNKTSTNLLKAILAGVGLMFFNLVFVFGLYMGVVATIFAFFISSLAFAFSGVMMIIQSFLPFNLPWLSIPSATEGLLSKAALLSFGVGLTALGLLLTFLFLIIGQWVYKMTLKYLKANISIIKKAGEFNEI